MNEQHLGRDFDDFLREEGLLEDVEAVAAERVVAWQVAQATKHVDSSKQREGPEHGNDGNPCGETTR